MGKRKTTKFVVLVLLPNHGGEFFLSLVPRSNVIALAIVDPIDCIGSAHINIVRLIGCRVLVIVGRLTFTRGEGDYMVADFPGFCYSLLALDTGNCASIGSLVVVNDG